MKALADLIVQPGEIVKAVNYYTAPVSGKIDPDAPRRQNLLLSALRTVPEISIHKGRFLYQEKWAGLIKPPRAKPSAYVWNTPEPDVVRIAKTEEKGSDVNIASHLVRDAFLSAFDIAYVLTNDTDLCEPIRIVSEEVGKKVRIVAPNRPGRHTHRYIPIPAPSLIRHADGVHYVDDTELQNSQFPSVVHRVGKKPLNKPISWV